MTCDEAERAAVNAAARLARVWQCICGQFNNTAENHCMRCGRHR